MFNNAPRMTHTEIVIHSDHLSHTSLHLYEALGLDVKIYQLKNTRKIVITGNERVQLRAMTDGIHVILKTTNALHVLSEQNIDIDRLMDRNTVTLRDALGNEIHVQFDPTITPRRIAVLTSGGDAPGMNMCVHAIVRTAIRCNSMVYGVYDGYTGLINDGIKRLGFNDVVKHAPMGGTFLRSSRCPEFMERSGRKRAVWCLLKKGIDCLVVLGGDGSVKGAQILRNEFDGFVDEFVSEDVLKFECEETSETNSISGSKEEAQMVDKSPSVCNEAARDVESKNAMATRISKHGDMLVLSKRYSLKVVHIPCSIDNDIPSTDTMIGSDTALHRVIECFDSLSFTMDSHRRAFVIEVMGRHCGFIALMSGFAVNADFVLLPESTNASWRDKVIGCIRKVRKDGKNGIAVILAEGATDPMGKKINAEDVKDLIVKETGIDSRVLKLGHIQRGGAPSARDRILSVLSGMEAVSNLLYGVETAVSICSQNNMLRRVGMKELIEECERVKGLDEKGNVEGSRGSFFRMAHSLLEELRAYGKKDIDENIGCNRVHMNNTVIRTDQKPDLKNSRGRADVKTSGVASTKTGAKIIPNKILVLHHGRRVPGMNVALNTIVEYCHQMNQQLFCSENGFEGLLNDKLIRPSKYEFLSMIHDGGSVIGCSFGGEDAHRIVDKLVYHGIRNVVMMGGVECLWVIERIRNVVEKAIEELEATINTAETEANKTSNNKNEQKETSKTNEKTADTREDAKNDGEAATRAHRLRILKGFRVILIPFSQENNIPGTEMSIGTDTALNSITHSVDRVRLSATSTRKQVFLVEVSGTTGYLSLMGGIASNAFECFIPERAESIDFLSKVCKKIRKRYAMNDKQGIVVMRCSQSFNRMSSASLCTLMRSDNGCYDGCHDSSQAINHPSMRNANNAHNTSCAMHKGFAVNFVVLGEIQAGSNPSPTDRIMSAVLGMRAIKFLMGMDEENVDVKYGVIGLEGQLIIVTEIEKSINEYKDLRRMPRGNEWLRYDSIFNMLQ